MSRYRGRHQARHAKPRPSAGALVASSMRRPAVSASLALAAVASGAAGVSAHESSDLAPAAFVLSADAQAQSDQDAQTTADDTARLMSERADLNAAKSAAVAQAEAEAKAAAEAQALARAEADAAAARDAEREAILSAAQSDPQSAARLVMGEFGFGDDQWSCLDALVIGESTWNYLAVNPSSGAYGLFQSLPAEKMSSEGDDWATNPVTQIRWGLGYIKNRYGTPCGAYNTWLSRSPHWY